MGREGGAVVIPKHFKQRVIKAWSYSRWGDWKTCPFKLLCKMNKVFEPVNYAMQRGDLIHKRGEQYLLGNVKQVPLEFKLFRDEMRMLKSNDAKPEMDLAVRKTWTPTTYNDWDGVWCRAKADVVLPPVKDTPEIETIDFKTGKKYDGHVNQAELMGLLGFSHFPGIVNSRNHMWYLDSGERDHWDLPKKEVPKLRKKWESNVAGMMKETKFKPTPGNHCRHCSFAKSKGGPCNEG